MAQDIEKNSGGDVAGFIGKGMSFEGRLVFENTVRIDGSFKGEISSSGTLVIGSDARVDANIKVDVAIIAGAVCGVIEASSRAELQTDARVTGEIRTPNLIIGEGALFEGNCVMVKKGTRETREVITYEGRTTH